MRLNISIDAVRQASLAAKSVQHDLGRVSELTKDDRSPVTVADFAAQAIVASILRDADASTPLVGEETSAVLREPENDALLGLVTEAVSSAIGQRTPEEVLTLLDHGGHDASASEYWVLDPVDGTKGFLRGEHFAVALGLVSDGHPTLGVLGCPNLHVATTESPEAVDGQGVIVAAEAGQGCATGGMKGPLTPVKRNACEGLVRVCTSVEAAHTDHTAVDAAMHALGRQWAGVRLDSQAKYGLLARDQADAYLRLPRPGKRYVERIWDHAAGALVAMESGTTVTDISGKPLDFGHGRGLEQNTGVIAAAPEIHSALLEAVGSSA